MANETNFFSKKLTLWKEATKGTTPATIAKAYNVTALSFSLTETQKTEMTPVLGNGGQGTATDFGASDYAGNVECKYTGGIMPILVTHTIGAATKTNYVSTSWALNTITTVGNVVNGATYSLVCKTAGTTGATLPTAIATAVEGQLITDGTVVWTYRSAILKKYLGSLTPCLETLGMQMESETGCGAAVTFSERYKGIFFNSLELSKSGGNVVYKYSIPAVAMGRSDSSQGVVLHPALTITSELTIADNSYGYDDATVTIGGVEPVNANAFRITINRNTSVEMGVKVNERIDNTPIVTVDGEFTLKFTAEQYAELYANPSKEVIVTFSKVNGDYAKFTFPSVETMRSPLTYATDKPIYLTAKLNAKGSSLVNTVSYEVRSTTDW